MSMTEMYEIYSSIVNRNSQLNRRRTVMVEVQSSKSNQYLSNEKLSEENINQSISSI
jgi:hypothetical protein